MDTQQRRLYIRWCQSERVDLLVGGLVGPTERFLMPREFLRRRSSTFRDSLERRAGESSSEVIQLPDTLVETMEDFLVWTFSPQPQIDERATFSEVVLLGIFAWRYQISALSNQVTDMIRSNLANGHWHLQASMVHDIYEAVPTGSPLREVTRAALGGLPRPGVEDEGRVREEWKATFLKHAQLGWDYCEAVGSAWTSEDYLSGACRFHDHQGVSHQEELFVSGNQCAYAREECFPSWEEESMKGREDEVVQERDGDQERYGADEDRKEQELSIEAIVHEAEEPVASEAVVDEVEEPVATEAVTNGMATNAGEAVVNGVVTEAEEPVTTEAVVDEAEEPVTTEGVVDEVEEPVTTEAVVDEVEEPMATEAVVNGTATDAGKAVVNGVAMDAGEAVVNGVATEAVVDGAEEPVATEAMSTTTEERVGETVVEKATPPLQIGKTGEKVKKKKKKRLSQSGQT